MLKIILSLIVEAQPIRPPYQHIAIGLRRTRILIPNRCSHEIGAVVKMFPHERPCRAEGLPIICRCKLLGGRPIDDGINLGPLVNKDGRDKVIELVADAVKKGAKVLVGGKTPDGPGFFYPATVLTNVPNSAKMLNEEIFGPVASIQTFKSEDEAIKRANDTEYGLVAYLYTKDLSRGMRVSEKLDYGMIGLNRGIVSDPAAPFGGTKQSGLGREGAAEGMKEFLETQYVSVTW